MNEQMQTPAKQRIIEQLWLTYYNDTLFSKGIITEEQRNRMRLMIRNRAAAKNNKSSGGNRVT